MFVNPQGFEPRAPNLCRWHPACFLLHITAFSFSSIVPLPFVCLSPPFQPPTSESHPAALPNPRPIYASRPPPAPCFLVGSCPTRSPVLHALSTPAAFLSSARCQPARFLVHVAWFYETPIARVHPWATWPPLSPPFVQHPILAAIAFFNSVTRHFQFRSLLHYFPFLPLSIISYPTNSVLFRISLIWSFRSHICSTSSNQSAGSISPYPVFVYSFWSLFLDSAHLNRSNQFKSFLPCPFSFSSFHTLSLINFKRGIVDNMGYEKWWIQDEM